jgi:phosphate transport system substrate-binding protein
VGWGMSRIMGKRRFSWCKLGREWARHGFPRVLSEHPHYERFHTKLFGRFFCSEGQAPTEVATTNVSSTFSLIASVFLSAALISACSQPPTTPPAPVLLRLSGSTSMQPLLRDLAAAYSERYPYVTFDFSAVGSTAGMEALRRGSADLALVSRELQPEEEYDTRTRERLLAYTVIAQDAVAVVVKESNPLRELTWYQVRNIFEGQVTTWDEVGSPAGDILVISREDGSGTRAVFEGLVMRDRRVTPTALIMPSSDAAQDYLATHDGAIGYLSLGYLSPGVATLAIDDVRPEREAVENGTYAITRPFLLVSHPDPEPEVARFMEFARSPAGQAIVGQTYGRASTGLRR